MKDKGKIRCSGTQRSERHLLLIQRRCIVAILLLNDIARVDHLGKHILGALCLVHPLLGTVHFLLELGYALLAILGGGKAI